jgi:NAD(P)-dependent dehydrogenase (short-subunit alcohol dehydrogenase family)
MPGLVTDFAGKTALITGAGRGIGRAVALGLAAAGARLILVARSASQLAQTQEILLGQGAAAGQVLIVPADLSDEKERDRAAGVALASGRVDILINNAGTVEPLGPTAAVPVAELRYAFELNVIAPAALTAVALPGMLEVGWGRVVNVSSGIVARPDSMIRFNAYAATKAALEAHTVNLAAELRGTGVTVNVFRPGGVDTAMQAWIRQQDPGRIGTAVSERFRQNFAAGTLITPEQSAAALIAHLGGDDTGAIWDATSQIASGRR